MCAGRILMATAVVAVPMAGCSNDGPIEADRRDELVERFEAESDTYNGNEAGLVDLAISVCDEDLGMEAFAADNLVDGRSNDDVTLAIGVWCPDRLGACERAVDDAPRSP